MCQDETKMPLNPELVDRATHNERLIAEFDIRSTDYLDWVVTVAFYVAVRYVDAYFWPVHFTSHSERRRGIRNDSRTRPIWNSYRELESSSRDARYELAEFTVREVESLIANRMKHVKSHMLRQ